MHEMLGDIVGAGSSRPGSINIHPQMHLSEHGQIVKKWIYELPKKYEFVRIDNYVIMPNHIHMILSLRNDGVQDQGCKGGRDDPAPTIGVGNIMGYFKYQTTKEINIPGFWQRSYHDHIIRNKIEYQRIWTYIDQNPANWENDRYHKK